MYIMIWWIRSRSEKVERERYVQNIVDEVSAHIERAGIKAKIDGRVKHFFSIYKKMKNQNKTIDQIYDLLLSVLSWIRSRTVMRHLV